MLPSNSVKHFADRDSIPVRKAQRYRSKLGIGLWVGGETGVWILTADEWEQVKVACTDAGNGDSKG